MLEGPATAQRRGKVWLVGAGPGDPGLLTLKAARALSQCDALVYDYLASPAVLTLAAPDCKRFYVGKKAGAHSATQDEIIALLVQLARENKRVVRLKGGDVFVFARGGEEAAALHAAGIPFEIVLGITSALAAPAYAGIPVTHRAYNTAFTVATGHEDPLKRPSPGDDARAPSSATAERTPSNDARERAGASHAGERAGSLGAAKIARLADPTQTLIFLMAVSNLGEIVEDLRQAGMPDELPVAVVREATRPQQETLIATLGTVVAEVERTQLRAPAVVIIGEVVREREAVRWFDRTPLFGKRVLVTRSQPGAAELANRLWEFGAEPVVAPAIGIGAPDDPEAARAAVARLSEYGWILFTSSNGVEACFALLAAEGGDARRFGRARVAAIGTATAERLAAHGIRADYVPPRFVAEELVAGLLERTQSGDTLLLFAAQERREIVEATLREHGRRIDVVAAYKTSATRDGGFAELAETSDIWTFASASAVHAFVDSVPGAADLAQDKTVAALGPVTADALKAAGLIPDVVADEATDEGLLAALSAPPSAPTHATP